MLPGQAGLSLAVHGPLKTVALARDLVAGQNIQQADTTVWKSGKLGEEAR